MTYQTLNSKNGFASVLLLLLVIIVVLGAVVYFVVMGSQNNVSQSISNLYAKPSPTVTMTPTPVELDKQLDSVDDSDPSSDFGDVDADIKSL